MEWKVHLAEPDLGDDELEAIASVLKSGWLTMGERTAEFERRFAEAHGARYAVAVSSCTAALHLALQAAGLGPGDEVICPSMTFVATSNAIIYTGATPVFAEIISLENPTISPDDIKRRITSDTKAVVVMHYAGYPCEIEKIVEIAREHSLIVIEDAAHAPLVRHSDRMLGTFGSSGCFSFYANKNMTTAEGGMAITDDPDMARRMARGRCHGISHLARERFTAGTVGYDVVDLGYNYRIDEIRAAIGIVQLDKVRRNHERRKEIVRKYLQLLEGAESLTVPFAKHTGDSAYHLFCVLLDIDRISRENVIEKLRQQGVQTSNHYKPVHLFSFSRKRFGTAEGLLPVTEEFGRRQITLPLYPGMSEEDVAYIVSVLKSATI